MLKMLMWIMQPRPWLRRPHRTLWPVTPRTVCCVEPPAWRRQPALAHRALDLLLLGVRAILVWHRSQKPPVSPKWPHHIPQLTHLVLTRGHVGALIAILCVVGVYWFRVVRLVGCARCAASFAWLRCACCRATGCAAVLCAAPRLAALLTIAAHHSRNADVFS